MQIDQPTIDALRRISETLYGEADKTGATLPGEHPFAQASGIKSVCMRNAAYEIQRWLLHVENLNGLHDFKSVYETNATEAK
jgi:hypothetical protein